MVYRGKRVLVTGGAGFLGSNLVKRLADEAKRVWVLDDLFTGRRDAVPEADNVQFVHGSVTDAALLRELLAEVDYVFHFAARNITLSARQPESDFRVNVEGSVQILLNALTHKHVIQRIVYASTASIYGNSPILPAREGSYDISVPYAASKLSAEVLAIAYGRMFRLPVTCLRFSNVYGPGQVSSNPYCGVVSKFFDAVQKGEPLTIYGDGTQTRDFTFVDDAMDVTLAAGCSPTTVGEVFNVGTGVETTVNRLAELVGETVGKPQYPVVYAEKRVIDTVYRRSLDSGKLREAIGWTPRYSLADGLDKTWEWMSRQT